MPSLDRGEAGWIIFIAACVVALMFLVCALVGVAHAQDHSGHRPQDMELHRKFYSTWMMPDNRKISCCHDEDCKPAEARKINGQWYAKQEGDTGDFTPIPLGKVEEERDTPDGRNHLCGRRFGEHFLVFCFIAGAGG